MKKYILIVLFLLMVRFVTNAQTSGTALNVRTIQPYRISASYYMTSNLIFPYSIKSVDRGSAGLLVQKAKGLENILQLKAAEKNFTSTNLSVVTGDGKFYSFLVDYSEHSLVLNYSFDKDTLNTGNILVADQEITEDQMQLQRQQVLNARPFLSKSTGEGQAAISLDGIYVTNSVLWFALRLNNSSFIEYKPEYVRFLIRDRKKSKRTAVQETELHSIYSSIDSAISNNTRGKIVLAFRPFTISREKNLIIQISEQGGGRTLI
ncbi:MAG: conjugative transposon protein TraN, partial [Flavisolibacter sp.]|nr:conjugative transposon protein TraN [Flavisolibacter sp.]